MILAAAMVCGMMAANVSCVSAKGSDEGKVINIYSGIPGYILLFSKSMAASRSVSRTLCPSFA